MTARVLLVMLGMWAFPSLCPATTYSVTDLGTLGGSSSQAMGVDDSGLVVGHADVPPSHAFLYDGTMHDLGTLPGGSTSAASGINSSGQIVGSSGTASPQHHAILYISGAIQDLGTLNGMDGTSEANGINDSGQITGRAETPAGSLHAFLYDGVMHDLGTLGGQSSDGFAINNSGYVTGSSLTTGNAGNHAFLYDGTMHDLGTFGGTTSMGSGINDAGQIVGGASTGPAFHAFLYSAGRMQDLGTLGGNSSNAFGINNNGQIVGLSNPTGSGTDHAFLYDANHGMVDLNLLISASSGWVLSAGRAINDAGQIAGYGMINGEEHAFLLNPVPEPTSILLGTFGIAALLAWRWHRSRDLRPRR